MPEVRLPRQRSSETVSVVVGGYAGRATVVRPDDRPPQVHLMAGAHGSTVAGLADALGTAISLGLANGAGFDDFRVALELVGLSSDQLDQE